MVCSRKKQLCHSSSTCTCMILTDTFVYLRKVTQLYHDSSIGPIKITPVIVRLVLKKDVSNL